MRLVGGWAQDPLWAHVYDWLVEHPVVGEPAFRAGLGSPLRLLHEAAGELGELPAGARVLDVPCGGGVALRGLRPGQGVHYVGADVSATMLDRTREAARRRGVADQVSVRRADVGALPWGDDAFDAVVTLTGLHCFPDPAGAVVEMARVLRPGGVLIGSTLLNGAGLRWVPLQVGGRLGGVLGPGLTATQLEHLLAAQGLTDVQVRRSGALAYLRATKPRRDGS